MIQYRMTLSGHRHYCCQGSASSVLLSRQVALPRRAKMSTTCQELKIKVRMKRILINPNLLCPNHRPQQSQPSLDQANHHCSLASSVKS